MSNALDSGDASPSGVDDHAAYRVPDSRVAHPNRDCHHIDGKTNVEGLSEKEAKSLRTCHQCAIDNLSPAEKRERNRKSRRNSKTTIRIRR